MGTKQNEKIKFIKCTDSSDKECLVFAEDVIKFKSVDGNTTEIFIDTQDGYKCSLGMIDLIGAIYGKDNFQIIPNTDTTDIVVSD